MIEGLNEDSVRETSRTKGEPDWILNARLEAYRSLSKRAASDWGNELPALTRDEVFRPEQIDGPSGTWDELAHAIDAIIETLGRPDLERSTPATAPSGDELDDIRRRNRAELDRQGVVFTDLDTAVREFPELVRPYLSRLIPSDDRVFSALNASVWSNGSFVYVPPGVEVELPLEADSRANAENPGQFARTLIVADEGSKVHYIEGCSAPVYTSDVVQSSVVEVIVKQRAQVSHTTIQNWSSNVFDLVTKRAYVEAEGHMEWVDATLGGRLTMKYPAVWLAGPKAGAKVLSVAYAGKGQHQDVGAKIVHAAPETSSDIVARAISKNGGRSSFRSLVQIDADAGGCTSHMRSEALVLDDESFCDTYPSTEINGADAVVNDEHAVVKIAEGQLFYLMSRGLSAEQATGMILNGFIEPVTRTLPMEYAVEWNRLIELQLQGSIG